MSQQRVLGNGVLHEGWRLVRVSRQAPAEPGQWYWLETAGGRWLLAVHQDHPTQAWTAGLMPGGWGADALRPETSVALRGPTGTPLPDRTPEPALLLGIGVGIGPILALAERLEPPPYLVLLDSSAGLPSRVCPSRFMVAAVPGEATGGLASLERRGIPSRIAASPARPGCFEGTAVELLREHLADLPAEQRHRTRLIAATPWDAIARWRHSLQEELGDLSLTILPAPA